MELSRPLSRQIRSCFAMSAKQSESFRMRKRFTKKQLAAHQRIVLKP